MEYLAYKPPPVELGKIGKHYWEVWRGLPDFPFENVKSAGGLDSLRYAGDGHYIWVPHGALVQHRKNRRAIYLARMEKNPEGKIRAVWLEPAEMNLEDTIQKALTINQGILQEAEKRRAKKSLKDV